MSIKLNIANISQRCDHAKKQRFTEILTIAESHLRNNFIVLVFKLNTDYVNYEPVQANQFYSHLSIYLIYANVDGTENIGHTNVLEHDAILK